MIVCPLCKGKGIIPLHPHPQNTNVDKVCDVCNGARDVEEVRIENKPIVIYKSWGMFAEMSDISGQLKA